MKMCSSLTNLDNFLPFLSTTDTKMKLSIGAKLYSYLADVSNSIECSDIGQLMDMLALWLQSSNFKVTQLGLEILTELVERMKCDFQTYLPSILPYMVDKLGDSKDVIREKTLFLLMKLLECETVNAQYLFDKIAVAAFTHKNSNIREQIMIFLMSVLDEFGSSCISISKLLPHIVKLLSDPNASVRLTAVNTLGNIYKHIGEKLRNDLRKKYPVPPNKLPALMNAFDEIKKSSNELSFDFSSLNINESKDETDKSIKKCNVAALSTTPMILSKQLKSASARKVVPTNSQTGGVDEDSFILAFQDIPDIQIYNGKDVDDTIRKAQDILNDVSQDWSKHIESLRTIRSLVLVGLDYEEFHNNINILLPAFHTCIKDLRSQVIRELCITIAFLAKKLGSKFDHFAVSLMNNLINLIQNSAKVVSSSSLICVRYILRYTHSPRLIPVIANSLASKSKDIRRACYEFICIILQTWNTHMLEKHALLLQNVIKKGIADADPEARVHSRKAYATFALYFPQQAELLLASLDYTYRKLLTPASKSGLHSSTSISNNIKTPIRNGSLNSTCTNFSLRSSSAIDLNAAKRAKVRAEYAAISRQKIGSITASLPRSKKAVLVKEKQPFERIGRSKDRMSVSQPTSRSASPLSKFNYVPYSIKAQHSPTALMNRSMDASPDTSTSKHNIYKGRLLTQPTCKPIMAQKILQQSQEAETAFADILGQNWDGGSSIKTSPRKLFKSLDEYSDESETSSICSEHSFDFRRRVSDSFARNGSQHRLPREPSICESVKEIGSIINSCESTHWSERKEGLINLQYYLDDNNNNIPSSDLKRIVDIFAKMFNDPHTKVFSLVLDTLNKLIVTHRSELYFALQILLTRLLNKFGTDLLSSVQSKIMKTLDIVCASFPSDLQLQAVCRYLTDPTQTPNTRVKVATLNYILKLTHTQQQCFSEESSYNNDEMNKRTADTVKEKNKDHIVKALEKMINWSMGDNIKQGPELRKLAQSCIVALFYQNIPYVTKLFSYLPQDYQELAANLIKNKYFKANDAIKSNLSDEFSYSISHIDDREKVSSNSSMLANKCGLSAVDDSIAEQPSPGCSANIHDEDIYKSFKKTALAFQHCNDVLSSYKGEIPSDSGASQMASVEKDEHALYFMLNSTNVVLENGENDMLKKYIDNLTNNTDDSPETKKNLLVKIEQIIADSSSNVIITNFKILLRLILSIISECELPEMRESAINLLQSIVKRKSIAFCFKDYIELIILKIMKASRDPCNCVVKAAENCAVSLSIYLPSEYVVRVIIPLIRAQDYPINLIAIKMVTNIVEYAGKDVIDENIADIMRGLLDAYDNPSSSVRKSAVFCIVALYKELGETISPYINTLRGAKLKLLQLYIDRAQQVCTTSGGGILTK